MHRSDAATRQKLLMTKDAIMLKVSVLTLMYAQEIGRMALEPQGAALMVPSELLALTDCMETTGWLGRNGARWAFLESTHTL